MIRIYKVFVTSTFGNVASRLAENRKEKTISTGACRCTIGAVQEASATRLPELG